MCNEWMMVDSISKCTTGSPLDAFVIDRDGILRSQTRGAKQPYYYAEKVLPLLQAK